MTAEADLLAAIDADPLADAPRLAYADWLDTVGRGDRAWRVRSWYRQRDPFDRPPADLPRVPGMSWEYIHGIPEGVRFEGLTAFKRGWPLTAGHRVRHVTFIYGVELPRLAAERNLASITSVELDVTGADGVATFLTSPHLSSLRRLSLPRADYDYAPHLRVRPQGADD